MQEIVDFTAMRDSEDTRRYKQLYGIDNNAYEDVADIIIDTALYAPDEIVSRILSALESRGFVEKI